MPVELICGDALEVMRGLADKSVGAIVTDPPYGLSFMGKDWDHGIPGELYWREALRLSKPGAHLLAFGGTRTFHRLTCAIEDAGWEIRDCIMWVYGSGFPKSHNLDGDWRGWGTALKPAYEPIIVARKPLEGTVAENVQRYGTGALNVDRCRIEGEAGSGVWGSNNATCQAGRTFNASPAGEEYRSTQHPSGRWPANVVHDGSDEVLERFPESDGCQTASRPLGGKCHDAMFSPGSAPLREWYGDSGSAARFFYCAKASRSEREAGLDGPERTASAMSGRRECDRMDEFKTDNDVTARFTKRARNHHPTVKPVSLMRWLCRLVTPPGGTVLDPFCGSGSTGIAADREGFNFIGIDLNPEYVELARRRIAADAPLFAAEGPQGG